MSRSSLVLWGAVLIAVVVGAVLTTQDTPSEPEAIRPVGATPLAPPAAKESTPAQVSLPADNSAPSYAFTATQSETVEAAMTREAARGLVFKTKHFPSLGSFVESINGVRNSRASYWMLYINGTTSSRGISEAQVAPGDRIEWRYE